MKGKFDAYILRGKFSDGFPFDISSMRMEFADFSAKEFVRLILPS